MPEDPYGYRTRDPSKTETLNQVGFTMTVNMAFFPVLFNDAHSCYVYTASVTEGCKALAERYWQGKREVLVQYNKHCHFVHHKSYTARDRTWPSAVRGRDEPPKTQHSHYWVVWHTNCMYQYGRCHIPTLAVRTPYILPHVHVTFRRLLAYIVENSHCPSWVCRTHLLSDCTPRCSVCHLMALSEYRLSFYSSRVLSGHCWDAVT